MKLITLISLLVSLQVGAAAYINKTQTLNAKGAEVGFITSYYVPTSYEDHDGQNHKFNEGESYMRADLLLLAKYGFTDRFEMNFGANFRQNAATGKYEDEDKTFSSSGLESGLLGLKYSFLMKKRIQYSFEASYRVATYSNKYYEQDDLPVVPEEIAMGEGSRSISAGFAFTFMSESQNFFTGRFLYRNPGREISNEVYSEIEGTIAWQYFALYLGVENIYSLKQDAYTNKEDEKPTLSTASSQDYNSINRTWTAPYIGMNIGLGSKWRAEFKVKSKLYGSSTTLGNEVSLALVRRNSKSNHFAKADSAFKEYRYEGSIIKVSKTKRAVSIDMGLETGVEKGSKIDFYLFDYLEGNKLIASGYVVKVGTSKAVVKLTKRFTKDKIKPGIIARAGLIK